MNLQSLRINLEQKKGQQKEIKGNIHKSKLAVRESERNLRIHEQAREVIQKVGLETQQQLEYQISEITSLALEAVFDNPYKLIVQFVQRRNKTECDLFFERKDSRIDPLSASGGGAVDVAAFALRIASWSMQNPKSRNVIALDEPFKHLRGEKENQRVLEMIKEISTKLNLQIIMIGDDKVKFDQLPKITLDKYVDKLFKTSIKTNITQIKVMENE